jgi:hypothetical protein
MMGQAYKGAFANKAEKDKYMVISLGRRTFGTDIGFVHIEIWN